MGSHIKGKKKSRDLKKQKELNLFLDVCKKRGSTLILTYTGESTLHRSFI